MNKIFICGRLTREPQVTHLQSGKGVSRFTIAVNRAYDREKADFIDCEAWEKQGELVAKYLTKGSQCIVEGELRIDTYEKDGVKRTRAVVRADRIEFIGGNPNSAQNQNGGVKDASIDDLQPSDDDDMPF